MSIRIELSPDDEARLRERAAALGEPPESLAGDMLSALLRSRIDAPRTTHEDWVALVAGIGRECGVSPPNEALSSDGLYD